MRFLFTDARAPYDDAIEMLDQGNIRLKRFTSAYWHENRVIRYVLRGSPWVNDLETTFHNARLASVTGSEGIFSVLEEQDSDYDEKLLDALAEV